MKPINIITEPIHITDVEECRIDKTVNEHFQAVVTGYVRLEEEYESYLNRIMESTFIISVTTEEEEDVTLFRGVIRDMNVHMADGLTKITVMAMSNTVKLDIKQHTRSFQGRDQTYREIIDKVLSHHTKTNMIQSKGKGALAKGLVIQYEETDWVFMKRMASQLHTVLVADCTNNNTCFYVGNPDRKESGNLEASEYQMRRYLDLKLGEAVEYILTSREIKNLCDCMLIKGYPHHIYRIESRIRNQELEFEYTFRPHTGFEAPEIFNGNISGVSIMGEVTAISDTKVQVKLSSEEDYDFGKPIWFPFSTVYSSPDGTGWYCMPEEGDRIRLYVPEKREETAYVISAVHLENNHDLRKDANEKCIRTKYQKEIRFTPDKIVITNHKGITMTLDDDKGIIIHSNRKIDIVSDNEIEIKGQQVQIEGCQGVILMEGPNMLMVRDGIREQGMNIEHR